MLPLKAQPCMKNRAWVWRLHPWAWPPSCYWLVEDLWQVIPFSEPVSSLWVDVAPEPRWRLWKGHYTWVFWVLKKGSTCYDSQAALNRLTLSETSKRCKEWFSLTSWLIWPSKGSNIPLWTPWCLWHSLLSHMYGKKVWWGHLSFILGDYRNNRCQRKVQDCESSGHQHTQSSFPLPTQSHDMGVQPSLVSDTYISSPQQTCRPT